MNVTLEIDELVLHGFPAEARYAVAGALEQELRELLAAPGLPPPAEGIDLDSIPALTIAFPSGATPQQVGRLVGRALYRALEQIR